MPVHRIPGGKGGAVFADRAEIDAWLVQPKVAADVGALPPHIDAIQGTENRPNVQAHDGVSSRSPVGASTVRRLAPIAIGLIVLAGVAATVIRIQTAGTVVPATFEFKAGTLIAHAPDDAVLWTFSIAGTTRICGGRCRGRYGGTDWNGARQSSRPSSGRPRARLDLQGGRFTERRESAS